MINTNKDEKNSNMAKNKTTTTEANVDEFIRSYANSEQKIEDSFALMKMMQEATGVEAKMYGPTIVGFGNYHYKYASGHEGDAPLLGFSPRKTEFSLYVFTGLEEHEHHLKELGKFKMGKACIYVKKLSDLNLDVLKNLMQESVTYLSNKYERTY